MCHSFGPIRINKARVADAKQLSYIELDEGRRRIFVMLADGTMWVDLGRLGGVSPTSD
jgi:hypothetical protein